VNVSVKVSESLIELGGRLEVRVARPAVADVGKVRAYVAELVCEHDCRGADNSRRVVNHGTERVDVANGVAVDAVLGFNVPADAAISYSGALLRNRWRVVVREDIARGRDKNVQAFDLVVVPVGGANVYTAPHPIRS